MPSGDEKVISNWSGDVRFVPHEISAPRNEEQLRRVVELSIRRKRKIRVMGAGHSCAPVFATDQTLVNMTHFKGFSGAPAADGVVGIRPATTLKEAGDLLLEKGLAMENLGHIDQQVIAGAIATGTHGAGRRLKNLSGQIVGIRLVNGRGEPVSFNLQDDPEVMQALKVSLGSMGIFTELFLKAEPCFKLHRRQYCAATSDCLQHLDELADENRNFCFYWYPRRDDVSIRLWNLPGEGTRDLPFARLYKEYTGWSKDVLPTQQEVRFNEMEYALDSNEAVSCFLKIRRRILERHRQEVAWRILFRPVAADDVFLSNAYGRNIVAITVHQNAGLSYEQYFGDIEKIFRDFGGRPHWAKKHSLSAKELRPLYPEWDRFQEIRQRFDPDGIFINPYLKRLFYE